MKNVERGTAKVADLIEAPYNPRHITSENLAALRASLERWGIVQEIVVNRRTGHVVGGNQRLKVLREKGVAEVPVAYVDLDDAEEKALNVTLNSQTLTGDWTPDLAPILDEIDAALPDVSKILRLNDLKVDIPIDPSKIVEDEVPEPPKKAITKAGDLWILGEHRLVCGDATKAEDVSKAFGGGNRFYALPILHTA